MFLIKFFKLYKKFLVRYLLNLAKDADVDLDSEVSYNDFVQPQMSAFAKLMLENARLQVSNKKISGKCLLTTHTMLYFI